MNPNFLIVVFMYWDCEPFICEIYGRTTIQILQEIEEESIKEDYFKNGQGFYSFTINKFPGQYGEFGRCELEPGWEFNLINFKEIENE